MTRDDKKAIFALALEGYLIHLATDSEREFFALNPADTWLVEEESGRYTAWESPVQAYTVIRKGLLDRVHHVWPV